MAVKEGKKEGIKPPQIRENLEGGIKANIGSMVLSNMVMTVLLWSTVYFSVLPKKDHQDKVAIMTCILKLLLC